MFETNHVIKFLMIGESGVGKSSFLKQFMDGTFKSQFTATIGIDFREKQILYSTAERHYRISLQLWDTAGQERYKSITKSFFRDAMGFIVLFDLTNEYSFRSVQNWIGEVQMHAYCERPDIVICGNKCDLLKQRVISKEQAEKLAHQFDVLYFETSACTDQNIKLTIEMLLKKVMARIKTNPGIVAKYSHKLGANQINTSHPTKTCSCYIY